MRKLRIAAAVLAAVPMVLGTASGAMAATGGGTDGWSCDGDVCMRYIPDGSVITPTTATGCSVDTCITVSGGPGGWSATGYADDYWYGHVDVWGPNGARASDYNESWPSTYLTGTGAGQVCAQGWKLVAGGYESVGLPCETVY